MTIVGLSNTLPAARFLPSPSVPDLGLIVQAKRELIPPKRRGSQSQGRALEVLGHAIEYLVDSRLFLPEGTDPKSEARALQTLMCLSRTIFTECPVVISRRRRILSWAQNHLRVPLS